MSAMHNRRALAPILRRSGAAAGLAALVLGAPLLAAVEAQGQSSQHRVSTRGARAARRSTCRSASR